MRSLAEKIRSALEDGKKPGLVALHLHQSGQALQVGSQALGDLSGRIVLQDEALHCALFGWFILVSLAFAVV